MKSVNDSLFKPRGEEATLRASILGCVGTSGHRVCLTGLSLSFKDILMGDEGGDTGGPNPHGLSHVSGLCSLHPGDSDFDEEQGKDTYCLYRH